VERQEKGVKQEYFEVKDKEKSSSKAAMVKARWHRKAPQPQAGGLFQQH
jgi:hypothetical protein